MSPSRSRCLTTTVGALALLLLSSSPTIRADPSHSNEKASPTESTTQTAGKANADAANSANSIQKCERLPTSLTYSQDKAPADVSAILRVVVEKINRDVTGVVDVEVAWSGAELHKRVGERIVRCTVTRLLEEAIISDVEGKAVGAEGGSSLERSTDEHGREVVKQCFEVPFTILDVDECTVSQSNPMAHQCHPPSICVNTLGSYECMCPSERGNNDSNTLSSSPGFVANVEFWNQLEIEFGQGVRSPWELSFSDSSESSCPGLPSTNNCCDEDGHSTEGSYCRSTFRCPVDPCGDGSTSTKGRVGKDGRGSSRGKTQHQTKCATNAQCIRSRSPLDQPDHTCQCPSGLMGNGRACRPGIDSKPDPKVKYDGKTPTEETLRGIKSGLICGCTEPRVDACSGFPKCPGKHEMCTVTASNTPTCTCKPGYVSISNYGCVDENPPILNFRPDPDHTDPSTGITHLTQGDQYEEYGVDVIDDNAEEYLRSLKISYSRPLPERCLLEMGEFYVNYTVATPWTTPNFVRATRTVVIGNVNECKVKQDVGVGASCPELVAMCDVDSGAMCVDEVGTYTCRCPRGTEGDGFKPIPRLRPDGRGGFVGSMIPRGYKGGTGCRDTSRPVIEMLGPNPKVFRVPKISGLKGVMKMGQDDDLVAVTDGLVATQRNKYEKEIRYMIKSTLGAELCATPSNPNVRPTDCVHAKDDTYKGAVDLTPRVSVGEPVPKEGSPLHWRVPYSVMDDAGNKAKTVWREVVVEEVDLNDFERINQAEIQALRKEMDTAVKEAVINERKRVANMKSKDERNCPVCDSCESKNEKQGGSMISLDDCDSRCDRKIAELPALSDSSAEECAAPYVGGSSFGGGSGFQIVDKLWDLLNDLIGPGAVFLLMTGCLLATSLFIFSLIISTISRARPNVRTYYHTRDDEERERIMMQNVTYYRSPSPSSKIMQPPGSTSSGPPPPTDSISSQQNGFTSPQESRNGAGPTLQGQAPFSSPFSSSRTESSQYSDNDIYQSMSPITPRRANTPTTPSSSRARYNLRSNY